MIVKLLCGYNGGMLQESFLGRKPSHFSINPVVKSYIISETFLWSSINFISPIFAVFAANQVKGGGVELAATSYSAYLIIRVVFELMAGKFLTKRFHKKPIYIVCLGIALVSISFLGLSLTDTVVGVYLMFSLKGIGIGIASPMKNTLFSSHIDKGKAPMEWGLQDAAVLLGMAAAAALGGFVAQKYGFSIVFIVAAILSAISIVPYLRYFNNNKGGIDITV